MREKLSYQLQCYLCEAARGGTLGGLSMGRVGVPSTCGGPGLRLLVTSGTSLSYSNKDTRRIGENYIQQPACCKFPAYFKIGEGRWTDTTIPKAPQPPQAWLKVIHKLIINPAKPGQLSIDSGSRSGDNQAHRIINGPCYSKHSLWAIKVSITWTLVRNDRISGSSSDLLNQNLHFNQILGNSYAY